MRIALAGAHVFAWVFLFHYFYLVSGDLSFAFAQTLLLYALSQVVTALATPYAARLVREGARQALLFAVVLCACAFVALGAAFDALWGPEYTGAAIALFAFLLGFYRATYWVPYELEAAGQRKNSLFAQLVVALVPAAAGLFVAAVAEAPSLLLYICAAIALFSTATLFHLPDRFESFSWGYRQTFHEFVDPANRSLVGHAFWEGVFGAALLLFWPLAIFLIVGGSYGMLGIVLSLTFLIAIILRTPVRKLARHAGPEWFQMAVFGVAPWLLRILVATPFTIIATDSYFYTTTPRRLGIDPFVFEQFSDGGSLLDEHTALKEIALSAGKAGAAIAGALIAYAFSAYVALAIMFLIAAFVSGFAAARTTRE